MQDLFPKSVQIFNLKNKQWCTSASTWVRHIHVLLSLKMEGPESFSMKKVNQLWNLLMYSFHYNLCSGNNFTPSIVSYGDNNEILVGKHALNYPDLSRVLYGLYSLVRSPGGEKWCTAIFDS